MNYSKNMVYVFWYKIVCLFVGLAIIYLGYLLFIKGVFNESGDVEANGNNYKLLIKKAVPGTYFVLFGSLIIALTVLKGYSAAEEKGHSPEKNVRLELPDSVTIH